MTGAWRYHTLPDCRRVWEFFRHVGRPEIARAIPACVKAGALALPLIGAPAATPIPVRPVLPLGGPFWAGETGPVGIPFGSPFAPVGALSPFAGGALADVGGFGPVGPFGYAGGGVFGLSSSIAPGGPLAVGVAANLGMASGVSVPGAGVGPQTHGVALPVQGVEVPTSYGISPVAFPSAPAAFAGVDTGADVQPVPEPASLAVVMAAVLAAMAVRRRVRA